jgi:hypothetical protein
MKGISRREAESDGPLPAPAFGGRVTLAEVMIKRLDTEELISTGLLTDKASLERCQIRQRAFCCSAGGKEHTLDTGEDSLPGTLTKPC